MQGQSYTLQQKTLERIQKSNTRLKTEIKLLEADLKVYQENRRELLKTIEEQKNKILKQGMELDYFRKEKSWLTNQLIKAKEVTN